MTILKTSFVIPTRNSGETIEECLSSLMPYYEQGYIQDIVLVDGLSTDDTLEKARRFPVKVFLEAKKYTVPLEVGWRNAAGDLVVFFDSDAYLGHGFFPKLLDFFADEQVGVMGCQVCMVVANSRISLAVAQWEDYSREMLFCPKGLQRLGHWISLRNKSQPPPTGPCHVARRTCLEKVDGYKGLALNTAVDVSLSRRIMDRGWRAAWWPDAPVYHHSRTSLRSLLRTYRRYGITMASLHREKEFRTTLADKAIYVAGHLAAPVGGLMMALRWRGPLHLLLYPLAHYTLTLSYLATLASRPNPGERLT